MGSALFLSVRRLPIGLGVIERRRTLDPPLDGVSAGLSNERHGLGADDEDHHTHRDREEQQNRSSIAFRAGWTMPLHSLR